MEYVDQLSLALGFAQFLAALPAILPDRFELSPLNAEQKRTAAVALITALSATERYIKHLETKHNSDDYVTLPKSKRDMNREGEIGELWEIASVKSRSFFPEAARMAQRKGGFWREVTSWSRNDITRHGISVKDARERIEVINATI